MTILEECRSALASPNVRAFLRVIREGESSQTDDAYRTVVGGGKFESFADHPRRYVHIPSLNVTSSAAGAYQFLARTWDEAKSILGLPDFSPESQDLAAVFLIRRRRALDFVLNGQIPEAIERCNREWASLPGSPYGQPVITIERALNVYRKWLSVYMSGERVQKSPESEHMKPFVISAALELAKLIPKLGTLFADSEQAKKNVAAAEVVVNAVVEATGAANAQEAVERVQSDPEAAKAADKAVESVWYQITEAGGGGVDGAHKRATSLMESDKPLFKNPAFLISLILVLFPGALLVDVLWVNPGNYSGDIRVQIVTAVLGLLAVVSAFWLGTSFGSQRKTDMLAK